MKFEMNQYLAYYACTAVIKHACLSDHSILYIGFFKTFFEPQFSRAASVKEKEEEAYLFFLKYIKECEGM